MRIAICVATYRRPVMLGALLESLAQQVFDSDASIEPCVVVVDNDAAGSARDVVEAARENLTWPLHSVVEPTRSISHARNRAVAVALAERAEWIAFIDDDEVASPGWLASLVRVQRAYAANVVGGPVISRYPPDTAAWMKDTDFLTRAANRTGDAIRTAETANVLVSARLLASLDGPFDPAFGRAGGGDSHLFLRARLAGARMVWSADAIVTETVPPSRARMSWLLQRAYRMGNCGGHVERAVLPRARWMPRRVLVAFARLALGTGMLVASPIRGRGAMARALWQLSLALGSISGVLGLRYVEYRGSHGH